MWRVESGSPERNLSMLWLLHRVHWTLNVAHFFFGTGGTRALGDPAQLPVALESRPEKCTACTLGNPPPLLRNAKMRSPMPYKHAISLIALLAGILKNGSRYGRLMTPRPPGR